jgi:hypothetical protein
MLKRDLWEETHRANTQCPHCNRKMTVRNLRWKHTCRRAKEPQVITDAEVAEKRRRDLEQKALDALNARLRQRQDAPRAKQAAPE